MLLMLSHLEYSSILSVIHSKFLRFIDCMLDLKLPLNYHHLETLLNLNSLETRRRQRYLLLFYNLIHCYISCLELLGKIGFHVRHKDANQTVSLIIRLHRTAYGHNSLPDWLISILKSFIVSREEIFLYLVSSTSSIDVPFYFILICITI